MHAPVDIRARKERVAAILYEKKKREERELQSDLGDAGHNGEPPRLGGLMHFIRYFWHILEPTTPLVDGWVMQAVALHLEAITRGEIKRIVINVPPGFCKSLMVNVFWPAWEWSAAGMPSTRYVTFSYGAHLTLRDNAKFRDLVTNPDFLDLWGDVVRMKKEGEVKPENDATGWKFASSVGGIGTGERGGRVLCDDLHNVKFAESETVRGETVRWVREGMSNRLNDMVNDVIVGIGQRVHEDDCSAAMLEDDDYVHLMIPMEYDPGRHCRTKIGWEDPRSEDGELAWPERFPASIVAKLKKTLGPYAYAAQYQQAPTPRGGAILKREWWQLWTDDAYPHCYYIWASADTAYTANEENDPTGFVVLGLFNIHDQPNIILMDAWRKRLEIHIPKTWFDDTTTRDMRYARVEAWQKAAQAQYRALEREHPGTKPPSISPALDPWLTYIQTGQNSSDRWPDETYEMWRIRTQDKWGLCEWLIHSCRRFRVNDLFIEGKASGLSIVQEVRRLAGNEGWGIHPRTPEGDKVARAYAVHSTLSAGLVWAPDREWAQMAIDEASSFPKGRYKDVTDALTQGLKHIRDIGLLTRPEERQFASDMAARYQPASKPLYPGAR